MFVRMKNKGHDENYSQLRIIIIIIVIFIQGSLVNTTSIVINKGPV